MDHVTVGKTYNNRKIANIECAANGSLENIRIKNRSFLLIVLLSGNLTFTIVNKTITAAAPCCICFDEQENPKFLSDGKSKYYVMYFHPDFLNVNMTFDLIRSAKYSDIANKHDMFLLKPFIDCNYIVPICENHIEKIEYACINIEKELREQRDWYWSCRGRSYFMELIISLERMYGLIGYGNNSRNSDSVPSISNVRLRNAILFIEGHYMEGLTLGSISDAGEMNHTTLTKLMKQETGYTAMEYLYHYRIKVAKKQLAFTEVPIKDIMRRCGFKTVQHFSRVFVKYVGVAPAEFRKKSVQKRKDELSIRK